MHMYIHIYVLSAVVTAIMIIIIMHYASLSICKSDGAELACNCIQNQNKINLVG